MRMRGESDCFRFVSFYGISTIVGYLMPNPVYICVLNIYDLLTFLSNTNTSHFLLVISHLFALCLNVTQFYLTHRYDSIRCYYSRVEWTWERCNKTVLAFPKAPALEELHHQIF